MRKLLDYLNHTIHFQRIFVIIFIIYYLNRLTPYTWNFSNSLLKAPEAFFSINPIFLQTHLITLIVLWLLAGLIYLFKPNVLSAIVFFGLSYFYVQRLNSYIHVLRYDFNPMAFLVLTLLMPTGESRADKILKHWIYKSGQFVWVSCFITGAVAKIQSAGWSWSHSNTMRDFIYFENVLQGELICTDTLRIKIINFLIQNESIMYVLGITVIVFEFLYVLPLFFRKTVLSYLVLTFFFQIGIEYTMNIQFYNYWIGLIFWLPAFIHPHKYESKL